ncbi:hypothetical protein [Actinomadura litoris]|uniref:hypothetical protein n=1 Tax=Actinomadura litoris TaxID=2678616 RepID=UPI001FA7994C|nr:hypothetical protein [Actinomadura litoris]
MTAQSIERREPFDLMTHSPDGESRGLMFRTGDLFPMDPRPHQIANLNEPATEARPWGLRHLVLPRAGKHNSDTSKFTTGPNGDGQKPEDSDTD